VGNSKTASLSREHSIIISESGLLTIAGGKWTTYRKMAEDCVNHAIVLAGLQQRPCVTSELRIHGSSAPLDAGMPLASYGSDAEQIEDLMRHEPDLAPPFQPALPINGAQVVWAARHEMARTLDDVLARRTRALYLNAAAAVAMAPAAVHLLARELGRDEAWQTAQLEGFGRVAAGFDVSKQP
jgi:glycerol-3-phosphate dehydrogenase